MQVSSRELLEFLEGSDDDDRDRRKRRRRKPRMWRSARERASWNSDMRQANTALELDHVALVDMYTAQNNKADHRYTVCKTRGPWPKSTPLRPQL